jgi:nucleoside-diphosphate-sugar epimerase
MGIVTAQDLLAHSSKVIYLGSAAEYGRATSAFTESSPLSPVDSYGLAKLAETSFMSSIAEKSFALTVVRPSSVYGPNQTGSMFIPSALRAAAIGERLQILKPLAVRDFLYIDDLAEAIVKMIQVPAVLPTVVNLSSGYEASMKDVADRIELSLGLQGALFTYPDSNSDLGQHDIVRINSAFARNLLNWEPHTSLEEGVRLAARL